MHLIKALREDCGCGPNRPGIFRKQSFKYCEEKRICLPSGPGCRRSAPRPKICRKFFTRLWYLCHNDYGWNGKHHTRETRI